MTLLPRSATFLFLGATPAEVVDLMANSELPEGGKFEKQYPGARDAILGGFMQYGEGYPDSVYAWSRWILPIMKKKIVPALFSKFDENEPGFKEVLKSHQENLTACEDALRYLLEQTGGTVPDDKYTYNRVVESLDYAQKQYDKVANRQKKNREDFDSNPIYTLWTTRESNSYDTMNEVFSAFSNIKNLADRYNIRINLNEFDSIQSVMQRQRQIQNEVEEKENERRHKEGFKSGQYQWDAEPIYKFKDGWTVYPVQTAHDLELEGEIMHHCIGDPDNGHYWRIQQGGSSAVSLRSPDGISHATAELSPNGKYIASLYGYHDHALNADYQKRMKEYFDQSGVDRDSYYYQNEQWGGGMFDDGEQELGSYENEDEEREPPEAIYEDDNYWSEAGLDPPVYGSNTRLTNPYDFLMEMVEWDEKVKREGQDIADITSDYQDDQDMGYDDDETGMWQAVYYTRKAVEPPFNHYLRGDEITKFFTERLMKEVALGVGGNEHGTPGPRNMRRIHEMAKGFAILEELTQELDHGNGHVPSGMWHNALAEQAQQYPDNPDVDYFMRQAVEEYSDLINAEAEEFEHEEFNPADEQDRLFADDEFRSDADEDWHRYNPRVQWNKATDGQDFPTDKPFDHPEGTEFMYKDTPVTLVRDNPPHGVLVNYDGGRMNVPAEDLHPMGWGDVDYNALKMPVDVRWQPGSKLMWRGQKVEVIERETGLPEDHNADESEWVKVKILGPGGDANYDVGDEKLLPKYDSDHNELFTDVPPDLPEHALEPGTEMTYNGAPVTVHLDWNDGVGTTEVKSPNGHVFTVDRGDLKPASWAEDATVEDGSLVGKKFWYGPGEHQVGGALQVTVEENDDRRARIRMPDGSTGYTLIQHLGDPVEEEAAPNAWQGREPLFTPGTEIFVKGENDARTRATVVDDEGAYLNVRYPDRVGDTIHQIPAALLFPQERGMAPEERTPQPMAEEHELVGQKFMYGREAVTIEAVGAAGYARVHIESGDRAGQTGYAPLAQLTEYDSSNDPEDEWQIEMQDPERHADGGPTDEALQQAANEIAQEQPFVPQALPESNVEGLPRGQYDGERNGDYEWDEAATDDQGRRGKWVFVHGRPMYTHVVSAAGQNWVYLNGQVARGAQPHHLLIHRLGEGYDGEPILGQLSHTWLAKNGLPQGLAHDVARGHYDAKGRPAIWESNTDRNIVWDAVKAHNPVMAGLTGKSFEGEQGNTSHITRVEQGTVPPSLLANLRGVRGEVPGEHRNKQGAQWDSFVQDVSANGVREPIFIVVDPGSEPLISEGSHRRDAAVEAGLTEVPVEIRYFGKAEDAGSLDRGIQPSSRTYDRSYEEMYAQLQGMGWDVMSSGPKAGLFCITIKNNETGGQVERTGKTQEQAAAAALTWAWQHSHTSSKAGWIRDMERMKREDPEQYAQIGSPCPNCGRKAADTKTKGCHKCDPIKRTPMASVTKLTFVAPADGDVVFDSLGMQMPGHMYGGSGAQAINSYANQGDEPRGSVLFYQMPDGKIWVDSIYSKDPNGALELFNYVKGAYPGVQIEGMFMNERLKGLVDRYNKSLGHTPMTDQARHEYTGVTPEQLETMRPMYEHYNKGRTSAGDGCRELHRQALKQGWRDKQLNNGWMLLSPDGINKATYHLSQSDVRAVKNFRAELVRGGFVPPTDKISKETNMDLPIATKQTLGQVFASLKPDAQDGNKLGIQAFKLGYSLDDLRTFLSLQDEDYQPGFKSFKEAAVSAYASRGWQTESALKLVLWNALTGQKGGPTVNTLQEGIELARKQMENVNDQGQQIIYRAQVIDPMFPGSPKWDTDDEQLADPKTEDWKRIQQKPTNNWEVGKEIPVQRSEDTPVESDWAFS